MRAGGMYFAWVFAAATVMGIVRTWWVAPTIGPLLAVAVELPVVMTLAWVVCRRTLARIEPARGRERHVMAGTALVLIVTAEAGLSAILGTGGLRGWFEHLTTPAGGLGATAQLAFAGLPLVVKAPSRPTRACG